MIPQDRTWMNLPQGKSLEDAHARALGISEDLVKISDRNLVYFFRAELRGQSMEGIPTGARKRLKMAGIITTTYTRGATGSGVDLTSYGKVLLKEDLGHTKTPTF